MPPKKKKVYHTIADTKSLLQQSYEKNEDETYFEH